jgi:uncharacterized NAD(P)/FAD-binding protein YdhS
MKSISKADTESHCSVAIVGGGFTGTVLAAELLRRDGSMFVTLIEPAKIAGRGVAYSTSCSWHLLNVPAGNMSAFPEDSQNFLRWARSHYDSEARAEDFLPRRVYGQYIEAVLRDSIRDNSQRFRLVRDEARAIEISDNLARIRFSGEKSITASRVVLALGNFQPSNTPLSGVPRETRRYLNSAWKIGPVEFEELAQEESILLVGSGLTAVDVAIALRAQEFNGTIHIVSRHGLLPLGHEIEAPESAAWDRDLPCSIRELLNAVRWEIARAEQQGRDWRCVIDSLRPVTAQIWQSLPLIEKRRFLRHVRPYWDVHRHRIAPRIYEEIRAGLEDSGIQLHAGRITQYYEEDKAAVVSYRERKSGEVKHLRVGRVINCTTPETDCRKVGSPLLQNLLAVGLVRPDPLSLGLDVAENGALIAEDGQLSHLLYTLGPALKGKLWESIAVPEIREQIARLAATLVERSNQGPVREERWADVAYSDREQVNF